MKFPKQIKIGGKTFEVKFDTKEAIRHSYNGFISHDEQVISLAQDIHIECQQQNLLHEIIHGIDLDGSIKDDGKRLSENEVRRLTAGLYQILKDNELMFR